MELSSLRCHAQSSPPTDGWLCAGQAETFDFLGLLENVRIQDLSSTGSGNNCPFLVGRALWLVARLKDHFPSGGEVAGQLLQAAVVGLLPSSPPPVQIGACRAVAALCQGVAGTHHLRAAAPQLYQVREGP